MTIEDVAKQNEKVRAQRIISVVMKYGVLVSSALISLGLILSPFRLGSYDGCPTTLGQVCQTNFGRPVASLGSLVSQLVQMNPLAIIELGFLTLIAIPFFRVIAGAIMYSSERDWRYFGISFFVLCILFIGAFIVGPYEAAR